PAVGIVTTIGMSTQLEMKPLLVALALLVAGVVVHFTNKKIAS
ncbi:MAG: hypothetical protein RIR69_393, partial [Actinomycetota bacterium]